MKLSGKEVKLILFLTLDSLIFLSEIIIGYLTNSLALLADAFHVLNDIASLLVALWAVKTAKNRQPDSQYTFGWKRAEILGALINAVSLLTLCITLIIHAGQRLLNPPEIINPVLVLAVGALGLASNVIGMFLFHEHGHSHSHGTGSGGHAHTHGFSFDDEDDHDDEDCQGDIEMGQHDHSHGHSHTHSKEHEHSHHSHAHIRTHSHKESEESSGESDSELFNTPLLENKESGVFEMISSPSSSASSDTLSSVIPTEGKNNAHASHQHYIKAQENIIEHRRTKSLNIEGVFLHVMGDALGNIGVIFAALFIWKTDFTWRHYTDPIVTLLLTTFIFFTALPLFQKTCRILLQSTPKHLDLIEIQQDLELVPNVISIKNFHIWSLNEKVVVGSMIVELNCEHFEDVRLTLGILRECLDAYGVADVTIQTEVAH